ncbi:MAG: DUF465 domain-containing protein [Croceibacterium sp.]
MSHTPNELAELFDADALHALKVNDTHFAGLAEKYHELNREIHRIEAEVEPASDDRTEELKKQRLAMLDEISALVVRGPANAG